MVPSACISLLTIGPGPDGGGSKKIKLRPHMPEKLGGVAISVAMTAQTNIEAETRPVAARPKSLLEMTRITCPPLPTHPTAPNWSRRWSAQGQPQSFQPTFAKVRL